MAIQPTGFVTPEEYLARERRADHKSEYLDGTMVAMVGTSRAHNLIVWKTLGMLYNQMRGRTCKAYGNDMRVKGSITGLSIPTRMSRHCAARYRSRTRIRIAY